jgi:hypothetical protein
MDAPNAPENTAADVTATSGNADALPADSVGHSSGTGISAPENPVDPSANPAASPDPASATSSGNPVFPSAGPVPSPAAGNTPAPEHPDRRSDDSVPSPPPADPLAVPPPVEPTNPQAGDEDVRMDVLSELSSLQAEGDAFIVQKEDVCANCTVYTLEPEAPVGGPEEESSGNAPGDQQVAPEEDHEQDEDADGDADQEMEVDQETLTDVEEEEDIGENAAVRAPRPLSEIGL